MNDHTGGEKVKRLLVLVILCLCVVIVSACADVPDEQAAIRAFDSLWGAEMDDVRIRYRDGYFYALVTEYEDEENWTEWFYGCVYDPRAQALKCGDSGVKTVCVYNDDDTVTESTLYADGNASFSISGDGQLYWSNDTENTGRLFKKMGNFEGAWMSGDTVIEFEAYDDFYRCTVSRETAENISEEWVYYCEFDPASCAAVCEESGRKYILYGRIADDETTEPEQDEEITSIEVYTDGGAAFIIDDTDCLAWHDGKEDAGAGLVFVRMDDDAAFWSYMDDHLKGK